MSYEYSEDRRAQQTSSDFMRDVLGWETALAYNDEILGPDGTFGRSSTRDVVLTRYLTQAIRRLNPTAPPDLIPEAIATLTRYNTAKTLTHNNQDSYTLLRDGLPLTWRNTQGEEETIRLRLFDFTDPANNHFLAIREMWYEGPYGLIRPDIMGYVNGLPLLFIECKNTHKSLKAAYNVNLANYKAKLPELFHHNALIILTNGIDSRFGSLTSPYAYFQEWKRLQEEAVGRVDWETMLRGICAKDNFLDIFENFILFDDSKGETRKIIARNHQYLGVNRAVESAKKRQVQAGKLGVFWHTQGSGKSYSMAFFTRKIHRKLPGNFTFLILTDREDLDTQIYKTFVGTGVVNEKDQCRATSGVNLKELLQQSQRYVFSLIQKFNLDERQPYTPRSEIIVISDEAHRTQYGLFARRLRHALPNAAYIGFTGTPLISGPDDELTKETFGDYVSTYDFQRAVEDGATVPLYYDNRGEKMGIVPEGNLNERAAEILEDYDPDEDQEARLQRVLGSDYLILTDPKRLDRIAQDFVAHYSTRWQTGKAMLICVDKVTAVKMHGLINQHWQAKIKEQKKRLRHATDEQDEQEQQRFLDWLEETERLVVISEAADEIHTFNQWGLDILPHRQILKSRDLETEFKKDNHPFRVAIVCAMWLTGFDVESLATLYVDKPMKSHTLMQAITRANRVKEGKPNGLIVDYNGLLKSLRKALATFATGRGKRPSGPDPVPPQSELLKAYIADIQACVDYLQSVGYDLQDLLDAKGFDKNQEILQAAEAVSINDNTRARFEVLAQEVFKKGKSLISHGWYGRYVHHHNALEAIYKRLKMRESDPADIIEILRHLQGVVDESVTLLGEPKPGEASGNIYDISKINFERLRQEFQRTKRPNTTVQTLKQKVEQKLTRMVQQNPTRVDLYGRYQEIIEEYNRETDRATIEKTFEALLNFIENLSEEEDRATREGLTQEYLTAYDLLAKQKNELPTRTRERIKHIAADLLDAIKAEIARMDNWTAKDSTQAQIQTFIYDYLYDETTGLPVDAYTDEEVQALAADFFRYVSQQYPQGMVDVFGENGQPGRNV
ncbi:MAG: type I restriction endonuclease subunit R [Chloroflexota bacterium]